MDSQRQGEILDVAQRIDVRTLDKLGFLLVYNITEYLNDGRLDLPAEMVTEIRLLEEECRHERHRDYPVITSFFQDTDIGLQIGVFVNVGQIPDCSNSLTGTQSSEITRGFLPGALKSIVREKARRLAQS